jgi:heparan-alpha-glucosaminide N-acetyltransferase
LFYEILDVRRKRTSSFPLLVLGMNSIAACCLYEALEKPLVAALLRHFTRAPFQILGPALEATLLGVGSLALIWLILWWMHRRKVFLRL